MLTTKINHTNKKQNTIIFVENELFLSGIVRILECYLIEVKKLNDIQEAFRPNIEGKILICTVPSNEMESNVKEIRKNISINIIIIKDQLDFNEIEQFIDLGVKGVLLADLDETYLVNTVKEVHSGNLFIDFRFTNKIMNEYKSFKKICNQLKPINTNVLSTILTKRELEIFKLLVEGCSNNEIGERLYISSKTVKNHVSSILDKMEVSDRLNAVIKAVRNNWIKIEAC